MILRLGLEGTSGWLRTLRALRAFYILLSVKYVERMQEPTSKRQDIL